MVLIKSNTKAEEANIIKRKKRFSLFGFCNKTRKPNGYDQIESESEGGGGKYRSLRPTRRRKGKVNSI